MSRWADLPPELLGDVSGRLSDAADFTRLHAVCTSWRDPLLSVATAPASRSTFLPWLLMPSKGLCFRCTIDFGRNDCSEITSMSTYPGSHKDTILVEPQGASFAGDNERNWVVSADGTTSWLFTDSRLVNVLTGAIIQLPQFPEHDDHVFNLLKKNIHGIVYADGTVFLYNIVYQFGRHALTAAILSPGYAAWKLIDTTLGSLSSCNDQPEAMFNNGNVILAGVQRWFILALDDSRRGGLGLKYWGTPWPGQVRDYCYVLESRGELLWVSVVIKQENNGGDANNCDPAHALFLTVHVREEEVVGGKMVRRWAVRHGKTLLDRVLFLGRPVSIAVDSTKLSMDGGCAYFIFRRGLFRYSFYDGKSKLLKQLHPVCDTDKVYLWLQPQPAIAPIHEIRKMIEDQKKKQQTISKSDDA